MKLLLVCNGGVSTSILAASIRKGMAAGESVVALPLDQLRSTPYDVVLVAPQIAAFKPKVETIFRSSAIGVIPADAYGKMDGAAVAGYARALLRHKAEQDPPITTEKATVRRETMKTNLKITLACNGGVSTKSLCKKIVEAGKAKGYEIESDAYPMSVLDKGAPGSDVILLGPQIKFQAAKIKAQFPDIPVEVVDMRDYGTMNGAKILDGLCAKYNW